MMSALAPFYDYQNRSTYAQSKSDLVKFLSASRQNSNKSSLKNSRRNTKKRKVDSDKSSPIHINVERSQQFSSPRLRLEQEQSSNGMTPPTNLIIKQSSPPKLNADIPEVCEEDLVLLKDKIQRIIALPIKKQAVMVLEELESTLQKIDLMMDPEQRTGWNATFLKSREDFKKRQKDRNIIQ